MAAHFQLIPRSRINRPHSEFTFWGNRLARIEDAGASFFDEFPARILLKGRVVDEENEKIFIQTGKQITLQQSGNAGQSSSLPLIEARPPDVISVTNINKAGDKQTFNLTAKKQGQAKLTVKNPNSSILCDPLTVIVGDFKYHDGMMYDLLAEVLGKSDDAYKLYYLQRLLHNNKNNTNLFYQHSNFWTDEYGKNRPKSGGLFCESVCIIAGEVFFGRVHTGNSRYRWNNLGPHFPLYKLNRIPPQGEEDIKYISSTVEKAREAIASSLSHKIPVVARCAYDIPGNIKTLYDPIHKKLSSGKTGGHCILIVGCNEAKSRFLYIDPHPGFSHLKYTGGMVENPVCDFLGILKIVTVAKRGQILMEDGGRLLEVLKAPIKPISPT